MENPEEGQKPSLGKCCFLHWQGAVIFILPLLFVLAMVINDDIPYRLIYLIFIMLICWATECFPLAITSMFPILAMPLMNIMESDKACSLYFKDSLVVLVITVIIACAVEFTKLHKRVALSIVKMFGPFPARLHVVLVFSTVILSILVPNCVCAAMMYPFTFGVVEVLGSIGACKIYVNEGAPKAARRLTKVAIAIYLSVAYAASIGGATTIVGSPTNIITREFYEKRFPDSPDKIEFTPFLVYTLPATLINTILMIIMMQITHMGLFRNNSAEAMALTLNEEEKENVKRLAVEKYNEHPPITFAEGLTAALLIALTILMFTRKPEAFDGWADAINTKEILHSSPATVIIFLIFALPAKLVFLKCWDEKSVGPTPGLLTWKFANAVVPWDLIFVIGCGGTLAEGARKSGLSRKIGNLFMKFKDSSSAVALLFTVFFTQLCTNFTVNAAVMTVLSPGIIELAVKTKSHPLKFLLPSNLAVNMAFLMPTATSPNALFGFYGNIRTTQMMAAGLCPTIATFITVFVISIVWNGTYADLSKFPGWISASPVEPDFGDRDN